MICDYCSNGQATFTKQGAVQLENVGDSCTQLIFGSMVNTSIVDVVGMTQRNMLLSFTDVLRILYHHN